MHAASIHSSVHSLSRTYRSLYLLPVHVPACACACAYACYLAWLSLALYACLPLSCCHVCMCVCGYVCSELAWQWPEQIMAGRFGQTLTARWQRHELSNFEYLMQLNTISGLSHSPTLTLLTFSPRAFSLCSPPSSLAFFPLSLPSESML